MLEPEVANQIKAIIRKHLPDPAYKIFIFGSRAEGNKHRKFSDVDVGILGPSPLEFMTKFNIEEDLENSNIPYLVDIIDFQTVNPKFKEIALSATIPIE